MKKVAVFGGSFDPPHIGHETIVNQAIKILDIDKIIIVPTFLNPFKNKSHLNSKKRLSLIKEIFKNNSKVIICDFEVNEKRQVPTIQTIEHLQEKYSLEKIYLIIGADNLEKLHLWNSFEKLEQEVEFVVATRDNIKIDSKYKILDVKCDISSTKIRENLDITSV